MSCHPGAAMAEPLAPRAAGIAPEVPAGPRIARVTVRVEYVNGAYRELTAREPLNPLLVVDDSGVVAGLTPGLADDSRREASVCLIFTGNPGAGGIEVDAGGLA